MHDTVPKGLRFCQGPFAQPGEAPIDALEKDVHQLRVPQTKPTDYGFFSANKLSYELACM